MDRVYVGNLPPDIRIKDIDDFFRPFGKLVSIDVNNRSNPAYALVQFDNERNAINAVRARCGYNYEGYTLQVKMARNSNDDGFEVRNQRRQVTPPPPPPIFNDFNNRSNSYGFGNNLSDNDFRNNNSGGFGNNTNFGNNNFGNKFVPDNRSNQSNSNFINPPSLLSNMSSQNEQYPTNNMASQNMQYPTSGQNMIEYPNNNRWGGTSNIGGGGSNRIGMGFDGNVEGFDRNGGGFNSSGGAVFDRNGGGFDRSGGGGGYNRGDDGFNRSGGGFKRNDGDFNRGVGDSYHGGGERIDYDNRYNDDKFQDSYTQGLSGSGRKWFNRYIRKGYSAKIAREKALEHRTVPYLRGGNNFDENPNTMPLPALETIGNKIISLFGAGGVDNFGGNGNPNFGGNGNPNFGGNGNQMPSNFSNWGGDNFQGDFSYNQFPQNYNDYNMAGRSSYNYDDRSSMSRRGRNAANRDGRPEARKEPGVLEKMLAEVPISQRKILARQQYVKSLSIMKRLEHKKDKDVKDRRQRQYHKNIIQEYEDLFKIPQAKKNVKNDVKTGREKKSHDLKQEYQRKKRLLYEDARRLPDFPRGILTESAKAKVRQLLRHGFEENGAKVLARLPLPKIKRFIETKVKYENDMRNLFNGVSTNKPTTAATKTVATAAITKPKSDKETAYHNNVKLLKKYEQSKNDNIKGLLLTCLKKVHKYEEEMKLPKTTSKFENLLPKVTAKKTEPKAKKVENKVESKDKQNETTTDSKENVATKDETKTENEKEEENEDKNEDACEIENIENIDLTEEQNDQDAEDQNDEDNAELQQDDNDGEDVELTEDQQDDEENVEFNEDEQHDDEDNAEGTEDQEEDNAECNDEQNDEIDLTEEQEEEIENENEQENQENEEDEEN